MTGVDAEPGSAPSFEDDNYEDDDFEEHDAAASASKLQSAAGQVHPLEPTDDATNPVAMRKAELASADGEDNEDRDGGADGEYTDDDFEEGEKPSPSITKDDSAPPLKMSLQAKSDGNQSTATSATNSSNDEEYGGDGDSDLESGAACPSDHATRDRVEHDTTPTVDLVAIHATRDPDSASMPPPTPLLSVTLSSLRQAALEKRLQQLRLSNERASVAAKRVQEYRETQARRKTQQAAEVAALKKRREQFRALTRKSYEQMGVSKLTGEQRYQLLVEEQTLLKQHQSACARLEKRQRWYNNNTKRSVGEDRARLSPAHISELQTRSNETRMQRYQDTVQRKEVVKAQQGELHKEAQARVAKCTQTQYVRGSYLLKATVKKPAKMRSPRDAVPQSAKVITMTPAPAVEPGAVDA